MEEKTDVPRQMCKHTDSFGHPADHDIRTCPECDMRSVDHGQTWISFEEYKKKYCREESQAGPADALSLAADGLAEALKSAIENTERYLAGTSGEIGCDLCDAVAQPGAKLEHEADCRVTEWVKALAVYEAAKESR